MRTLHEHIDDLDRMVDRGAEKPNIRSQIAFIAREVATLEADYARLADAHTNLQEAKLRFDAQLQQMKPQATQTQVVDGILFECSSRTGGAWLPFCPVCGIPVQIHERIVNVMCADSRCTWASDVSPDRVRKIIAEL
jgi:hypothetical protein